MEECGAGLPARNGLAQPLVKAGVLLICNGFSRSQKMHKSVYNSTVRVARLLHRPSYKFITRNTTVWKKSVSEHPLSPASPRKADVPAPAPLREGSQPQPLSIHPGAAALKPRSTWTCPGSSLASKGSRSYKSHFSSSLCATSLLVVPDFYMPSQGAAAFAAIPREARHTRDRNRCCCRAARDDVAQWLAQISKPAQGQPLAEPTGHDGQHSHRLCSTKHTEKEEAWSSRSNRTRDCKCIQSYTPGKVGYVCSQLWFSVTHSTHRFSAKVRFDSQSQLRNTTDRQSISNSRCSAKYQPFMPPVIMSSVDKNPAAATCNLKVSFGINCSAQSYMLRNVTWLWTSCAGFNWKRSPWDARFCFCKISTLNPHFLSLDDYS